MYKQAFYTLFSFHLIIISWSYFQSVYRALLHCPSVAQYSIVTVHNHILNHLPTAGNLGCFRSFLLQTMPQWTTLRMCCIYGGSLPVWINESGSFVLLSPHLPAGHTLILRRSLWMFSLSRKVGQLVCHSKKVFSKFHPHTVRKNCLCGHIFLWWRLRTVTLGKLSVFF